MSSEISDQEDEEVEEVMEADIVSLTLDPPPANAAAVLHQHHLHHHHGHYHGPNAIHGQNLPDSSGSHTSSATHETTKIDAHDVNEMKLVDNRNLSTQADSLVDRDVTFPPHHRGPTLVGEQESNNFNQPKKENDLSTYMPQLSPPSTNYTLPSIGHQSLKSAEVLPKKSSFSCLKSKSADDEGGPARTKKSVKFPEDESIISMKVEPVNPWKDGNNICLSIQ